jgi:cytochrome c biogenesis protein CcmG, thiol:disulfide interchange protein DsbE
MTVSTPPDAGLRPAAPKKGLALPIAGTVLAILIAVAAVVYLGGRQSGQPAGPAQATGFSIPSLGHPGQRASLAQFTGRPVIVNFFASWCGPCQRETPELAQFYRQSGGRTVIIGVDSNDQASHAMKFVAAKGVGYPVGVDPFPARVTTSYGVTALPQTFFLNAQHRIVKRVYGAVTAQQLRAGVALMDGQQPGNPG